MNLGYRVPLRAVGQWIWDYELEGLCLVSHSSNAAFRSPSALMCPSRVVVAAVERPSVRSGGRPAKCDAN